MQPARPSLAPEAFILHTINVFRFCPDPSLQVPVRFEVPRKGTSSFQADLYPDTAATVPAHSAADYFSGKNSNPRMMKMDTKAVVDPLPYEPYEPVRPSRAIFASLFP